MENKRGKFLSAEANTQLSSLLHALKVLKEGDFTVRLPITEDGLFSEIAGAFNDIVALDEGLADEIARANKVIGEEGNLAERLSLGEVSGAWNAEINSLNALIDNLAQPTTEVTRVITAVARGDLSEKMTLEIEGRAIKGEFLRMGNTINTMVDQLHSFSAEVTRVARAVGTEDILGGQADVPGVGGTWKDLIEREQAEHALKYSEVKYRRLFEAAQDGILIIDADTGQITDVNPFLTDMLGYSPEELLGKKLWEIGPFKDIEASRLAFQELQSQGYVRYEHLPLENKSGQQMAVEFVSNVYTVNSQRVIQCNIRDITKRIQMKEELRESESHYKELAESISDVFFGLDTDLRYTYWNEASEKLTGVPARDTLGKHPHEIFPDSEQSGTAVKAYKEALRTKKPQYFADEYRLGVKDVSFEISVYPSKSGLSVFAKDVTGSKRIERQLWDTMSNFHKVISDNPDGIIITNHQGIINYVNPAAESLFSKKNEDFNGKQFSFPTALNEVTEINIIRQPGEIITAEVRMAETLWYDDISYLISLHDITERKKAQLVKEKLTQQLQAKVNELEVFSYGIAHDLKSPMVSIEGFSRLLREDIKNRKGKNVREDIRLLESGVRKMQSFLNGTLEYSRAGQLKKRTMNVSFGKIVNEVITELNEQISSIGATVSAAKTFPRVHVDRTMIIQALTDLVQNSIKYRDKTAPLKIEIGYRPFKGGAIFFVRDNGIGIDAGEAEKVFNLFYRGTADREGSGIGLAIVKKIIEAHGGAIWVQVGQSEKGTTMCFTLPRQNGIGKGDTNDKD